MATNSAGMPTITKSGTCRDKVWHQEQTPRSARTYSVSRQLPGLKAAGLQPDSSTMMGGKRRRILGHGPRKGGGCGRSESRQSTGVGFSSRPRKRPSMPPSEATDARTTSILQHHCKCSGAINIRIGSCPHRFCDCRFSSSTGPAFWQGRASRTMPRSGFLLSW